MRICDGLSVLIVDDEPLIRDLLVQDLTDLGANAQGAQDGASAMGLFLRGSFDVVVSDVRMPRGDGLELLARVREVAPEFSRFFLMSGYMDVTEAETKAFGAAGFLLKPFGVAELVARLKA